jgi:hypothetical protein
MRLERPADESQLAESLVRSGYGLVSAHASAALLGLERPAWAAVRGCWESLPRDEYLKDGGRYRTRRHGSFVYDARDGRLDAVEHRAHWQPVEYNALHGGMHRRFAPLERGFVENPFAVRCIVTLGAIAARHVARSRLYVEVHQVRIDTAGGIGRPTPEGAHRDGVDVVAVWLAGRDAVRGGETRVFEADGEHGVRFTMSTPGEVLVLDDHRVLHETTPILPGPAGGSRDTLVVTYRAGGFLEPPAP